MAVERTIPGFRTSVTPRARGPQVDEIQFDALDESINNSIELKGDRIDELEESYASLKDIQDEVLGIRIDNPYQGQVISNLKGKSGLDDSSIFDLGMNDLENPYTVRNMKTNLTQLSNSQEFKSLVENQTQKDIFEKYTQSLKHTNPELYKLALQDLIEYKNDETGAMTGMDLIPENYTPMNVTSTIQEELGKIPISTMETPKTEGDYTYVEKVESRSKKLAETVISNSLVDPKIMNNLIAQGYMEIEEDGTPVFTKEGLEWKNTLIDEYTKQNIEIDHFKQKSAGSGGTQDERTANLILGELADQGLTGLSPSQAIAVAGGNPYDIVDLTDDEKLKYPDATKMLEQKTSEGKISIPLYPMSEEEKRKATNSKPKSVPNENKKKQETPTVNKDNVENPAIKEPEVNLDLNADAPVYNEFQDFLDWAENGGNGENSYSIPEREGNKGIGRYQIEWKWHGDEIKKVTGVGSKEDFINSPEAQDKYMEHLYDGYVKQLPDLRLANISNRRGLSDDELLWAMHNRGTVKSVKSWMESDRFYDRNDATTKRLHDYIDSQVDIVPAGTDEGPDQEAFVKNKNGAVISFPEKKGTDWQDLSISAKKVLKNFPFPKGIAVTGTIEPGHKTHKNGDEFDIRVMLPDNPDANDRIGAKGGADVVQELLNNDEMLLYLYNNGYEALYEGSKKYEEDLNGKDYWAKPLFKVTGDLKYTTAPHLHFQRASSANMKKAEKYLRDKGLLKGSENEPSAKEEVEITPVFTDKDTVELQDKDGNVIAEVPKKDAKKATEELQETLKKAPEKPKPKIKEKEPTVVEEKIREIKKEIGYTEVPNNPLVVANDKFGNELMRGKKKGKNGKTEEIAEWVSHDGRVLWSGEMDDKSIVEAGDDIKFVARLYDFIYEKSIKTESEGTPMDGVGVALKSYTLLYESDIEEMKDEYPAVYDIYQDMKKTLESGKALSSENPFRKPQQTNQEKAEATQGERTLDQKNQKWLE